MQGWKRASGAVSTTPRRPGWCTLKVRVVRPARATPHCSMPATALCICASTFSIPSANTCFVRVTALPPSKHRTSAPRSVASLEAELRKLRKENEGLRTAAAAAANASVAGASFAPFNTSPSVSLGSMAQYPSTPGVNHARQQAAATPHGSALKVRCSREHTSCGPPPQN